MKHQQHPRRTAGSVRRKAQAELLAEHIRDTPPSQSQPLIDSKRTQATPCPIDAPATEETLP